MAQTKLDLLPRKAFVLTLADGRVVEGQFSTWSWARFGQKRKMGLEALTDLLTKDPQLMDLVDFVVCAIEYKEREAKQPTFINEIVLSKFIDDYADEHKVKGVLMTLFNHAGDEEEKKSDQPGLSPGAISNEQPQLQES